MPKGIKYCHLWREGVWRATKGPYVVLNLCLATDSADAPGVSDSGQNVQNGSCFMAFLAKDVSKGWPLL